MENRMKLVMKTSIIGIIVNLLLALFKIILGSITNAISILTDGINNLSDAGSSLITIVGTALAGKPADKKHPFGYGRIEYLSTLIISGLVLYAGVSSLVESIRGIIKKETPEYTTVSLVVMAVAVVIKLALSLYTQAQGKKANSDSLVASGKEAILDVFVSVSTIVAAIIYLSFGLALEAYVAAVISLFIIKTGFELLMEIVSTIIGSPAEADLVVDIKKTIRDMDKVYGAYDLILNDYGPETYIASVHVEVDDTLTAKEIDALSRNIVETVMKKHKVTITAVGLYCHNTQDKEMIQMESNVKEIVTSLDGINSLHGFYANFEKKEMQFDLVVTLNIKNRREAFDAAIKTIQEKYPEYKITSAMDADFNELKK